MTPLDHVRALSEGIGSRGSATEAEARAADYVTEQLSNLGYQANKEVFLSATSSYAPYALGMALALLSLVLLWQTQPVGAAAAAILNAVILGSLILELLFRPNLLRWVLPIEDSQNIVARIIPANATTSDEDAPIGGTASDAPKLVITAHLDTHRTPLVFSSPAWLTVFRWLLPIGLGAIVALLAISVVGIFTTAIALRWVSLAPGVCVLFTWALMFQADRTPYTQGANDNASGVAATLELAHRLASQPLRHTEVILVFTGCEEVGCYGADAFFEVHQDELRGAMHLVVDQVATPGAHPAIVRSERFLASARSDAGLLDIADCVAARHPEWSIGSINLSTGYGELSVGVKHGLRALAFGGFRPDGSSPHWHQASDVIANIDESVLAITQELVWEIIQEIDGQAMQGKAGESRAR